VAVIVIVIVIVNDHPNLTTPYVVHL